MSKILESGFEYAVLALLAEMGSSCYGGAALDPDASSERESYHDAIPPIFGASKCDAPCVPENTGQHLP